MSIYLGNQLIAGDNSSFANQDLSNLSATGQAVIDGKADTDLSNCTRPYIVETYSNGFSWYRVYSDGFCMQGTVSTGTFNSSSSFNLLKAFKDTNYSVIGNARYVNSVSATWACLARTTTSFTGEASRGGTGNYTYDCLFWVAYGYIS